MLSKRMLVVPIALGMMASCALFRGDDSRNYTLAPGPGTPGATGHIRVTETDTANQEIRVEVRHMPRPEDIQAGLRNYVVWAVPPDLQTPINLGELVIDDDREGDLRTLSPYETFEVLVTAEPDPRPEQPGDTVVLRGNVPPG